MDNFESRVEEDILTSAISVVFNPTLTIFENATIYIMAGFHEIQMTTIHIKLHTLLSNHLNENTFPILSNAANLARFALRGGGLPRRSGPRGNKSNRKAMNRNWSNQKANPALKTKTGNK